MAREPILTDPGAADPLSGPPKAHSVHDAEVVEVTERNRTRVFDVLDYGAVCDRTTDDTTAIEDALTDLEAEGGGTLRLHEPGPLVSSPFELNVPMIVEGTGAGWQGSGGCAVVYNGDQDVFRVLSDRVTLRDFEIIGDETAGTSGAVILGGTGASAAKANRATLSNLEITGASGDAIRWNDGVSVRYEGVGIFEPTRHGIYCVGDNGSALQDNQNGRFDVHITRPGGRGVWIEAHPDTDFPLTYSRSPRAHVFVFCKVFDPGDVGFVCETGFNYGFLYLERANVSLTTPLIHMTDTSGGNFFFVMFPRNLDNRDDGLLDESESTNMIVCASQELQESFLQLRTKQFLLRDRVVGTGGLEWVHSGPRRSQIRATDEDTTTANDYRIQLAPGAAGQITLQIGPAVVGMLELSRLTTAQRDALLYVQNGMIFYNETTQEFQGRKNGAWVDFLTS